MSEKMATILIVDDHRETSMLLMRLFRHYGHTAEIATSGHEALEYLQKQIPQFVILDFMMPDMDGLEVLREIRQRQETSAIPVAMYTAVSDPKFQDYARQCGANDVWTKMQLPFDKMMQRMDGWLSSNAEC